MAMPRRIPIDFNVAFPYGGYLVTPVSRVSDFERSTAESKVQQIDKESDLPLRQVESPSEGRRGSRRAAPRRSSHRGHRAARAGRPGAGGDGNMGWSSTAMAARYQHVTDPIRRDVARRVGS